MDPIVTASLIAGGADLLGGTIGGIGSSSAGEANARIQRKMAQHGISWKVADAKAAGIHPLYALGATPFSYSPSHVGGGDYGISQAGQNISRAIANKLTPEQKMANRIALKGEMLKLKEGDLRIELLKKQIRDVDDQNNKSLTPDAGNPLGLPGQGGVVEETIMPGVEFKKKQVERQAVPGVTQGVEGFEKVELVKNADGSSWAVMNPRDTESLEENVPLKLRYFTQKGFNRASMILIHSFPHSKKASESRYYLKKFRNKVLPKQKGYTWLFNPWGGFRLVPGNYNRFYDIKMVGTGLKLGPSYDNFIH